MLPKPYYSDDAVTIYHADCRDILPELPKVDLVLTDPPYGIAKVWKGGWGHGWENARCQSQIRNEWDAEPPSDELLQQVIGKAKDSVIWGGNYFNLPVSRGWLVWNKPERGFSLAEAELAWTTRDNVLRVFDCNRSDVGREHPTQKPVSLMRWCLTLFPDAHTILDPFLGSGTTIRAALDCGRKCIGIEIEEKYCEIAAKRCSQTVMALEGI